MNAYILELHMAMTRNQFFPKSRCLSLWHEWFMQRWCLGVATLALGLRPRQRGCKVAGPKEGSPGAKAKRPQGCGPKGSPRVTSHTPGNVRKCEGVWGSEHSHSQGNSHFGRWSPGELPKWARIAHLDIWNTSYDQKKGRESNWQFDSRSLKVGNQPLPDIRFESTTRRWKALDESYNFASDLVLIGLCSREIWASKVPGLQPGTVSGLQLGSPGKNSHLDVTSVTSCRVYYTGEGGGFPQARAVVSLVCPCCPCLVLAPRVLQLCINHLVWVVCRPVWVSEACQLFLVPS
jgi:hypothetical protein